MPKSLKSLQVSNILTERCFFNPFNLSPHLKTRNYNLLWKVRQENLLVLNVSITKDSLQKRICNACRLNLPKLSHRNENDESLDNLVELKILAKQTGKKEIYLMASPHYRRIHQCRHVMMHFIQTLQNYIVGEVLQISWEVFKKNLENVVNLDDLYNMHTTYIKNILFMCLLNQKTLQIRKVIQNIFVVILKFYDYLRSRSWTCEDGVYEHPNFVKLESIFKNFEEIVLYLFKVGRKVAKSGYQPHLTQLLDMLDINGYYSNRMAN